MATEPTLADALPEIRAAAAAPAPQPATPADRLYGPPPAAPKLEKPTPEVQALREEPARKLHPASARYPSAELDALMVKATPLASRQTIDRATLGIKEAAGDMDASPEQLSTIVSEARALVGKRLSADEKADMQAKALRDLRERYGDDAGRVFGLTKQLVSRDQRFKRFLDQSGAGDSPRVVLTLAELAVRAAGRGQLKAKGAK